MSSSVISASALWARGRQVISILRLSPFDTSTAQGRSQERYRRLALTTITSAIAKGVALLTTLFSVPLTVNYLGTERFGLWMTMSSVTALLAFADLGMGNGLLNAISEADGEDSREAAQKSVSSGFYLLLVIGGGILATFFAVYAIVPWPRLFNVSSELAASESGPAIAIFVACLAISMPLGIVQRVQMGYQEGFVNNLWQSVGSVVGLVGVILAVSLRAGLPWLVLAMSGGSLLTTAINWLIYFIHTRPWLFPSRSHYEWTTSRKLASTGVLFLILQVMALVGNTSDNLVIAQMLGASAVAGYVVVQKLFSIAMIAQFFTAPLWPAFGEAMARSDYAWARRTLNRALKASLTINACIALPLLILGKSIITVWAGPSLAPSSTLLIGFIFWTLLSAYGGTMSAFLNHGSLLSRQVVFYSIASLVALALKIVLVGNWHVSGAVWATVIGYGLLYCIPANILARNALRPAYASSK